MRLHKHQGTHKADTKKHDLTDKNLAHIRNLSQPMNFAGVAHNSKTQLMKNKQSGPMR